MCSKKILSRKNIALCCEYVLHASVQRENLVVAAEGLLKMGVSKCVCV